MNASPNLALANEAEPGIHATFASLLEPVLPRAYRAALHMTQNPADAEDVVQNAALQAFRKFDHFEPGTNFKAWFLRIVTNEFLMDRRKERVRPTRVSLDAAPDLYLFRRLPNHRWFAESDDPAGSFIARLETDRITAAIHELPEEYRVVASLYFLDDLSYQGIADAVGCPVGTVRSRLHRARKMLQVALWDTAREHGIV